MLSELATPFEWKLERIRKRIKLKDVAQFLECSNSLLSRYENEEIAISSDKVASYRYYIKNYSTNKGD